MDVLFGCTFKMSCHKLFIIKERASTEEEVTIRIQAHYCVLWMDHPILNESKIKDSIHLPSCHKNVWVKGMFFVWGSCITGIKCQCREL